MNNISKNKIIIVILTIFLVSGTILYYLNITKSNQSFLKKYHGKIPSFTFSKNNKPLLNAINNQLKWFSKKNKKYYYGDKTITGSFLAQGLIKLKNIIETSDSQKDFQEKITNSFDLYILKEGHNNSLLTSYYSPIFQGSFKKDDIYKWPLYKIPDDAYTIKTNEFDSLFLKAGNARTSSKVVARIDSVTKEILPYYTREEIDIKNALAGKKCEIIYLEKYLDQFILHIQGGGFIKLPDSTFVRVNFAGKNSHRYRAIGKILLDEKKLQKNNISIKTIKEYLTNNPKDLHKICNMNPSYVFYTLSKTIYKSIKNLESPYGSLNFPVTSGVSLACDKKFFPGGELAFLTAKEENSNRTINSFVIDQDTGGAINDNHFDFYAGIGNSAGDFAGTFLSKKAALFFLLLKEN